MKLQTRSKEVAAEIDSVASVTGEYELKHITYFAERILNCLKSAMYPHCFTCEVCGDAETYEKIRRANDLLIQSAVLLGVSENAAHDVIACAVTDMLPEVKRLLETDLKAAYFGDPAARNYSEIILAYPAFEAICTYRIAHILYTQGMPVLPRIMTEAAHRKTGIDIHPGAKIGEYFFIDHGTGVVIGETTTIGNNVKLYQGVTLGAKSFEADGNGNPVKGIKRHPDIGNNVTIYARTTILGGSTRIGDNCVIGGNVWLTDSVEANKTVMLSRDRAYDIVSH